MSTTDGIVTVNISTAGPSISRVGFSTINVFGTNKAFSTLSKRFANNTEVLSLFLSTDKEAIAASDIFAQNPTVPDILISRRDTNDVTTITVDTVVDNTNYTCTINGTAFTIDSGAGASADSIALALITAINAGSEPVTAATATSPYTLTADVAGVAYSVKVDLNQSMVFTTIDTNANDLANIDEEDDDWYGLVATSRVEQDQLDVASWVEGELKFFATASDDTDIPDTTDAADTTSLAAQFKALSYRRTELIYHTKASTEFIDAANLGKILPLDPGSYTKKFKNLASVTVDKLSTSQKTNISAKNANHYTTVAGLNILREGTVSVGEFIDVIIFIDWLQVRMEERIFVTLTNTPKVPFTDPGIAAIEADIVAQLQDGVAVGGLAADPPFTVTVPLAADISAGDKASRTLNGVTFQGTLAGAIHFVIINGNLVK